MTRNTLTVRVESNDEFFDRALEAAAKADAGELTDDHTGLASHFQTRLHLHVF